MFRSALFKLTAAYVAIVMSICVVFSIVLHHAAVSELQTGFHNQYSRLYDAYERYGLHQPGTPAQELSVRSHHILLQIIYFNIFVLIVTTVACYLLARRTLQPIEAAHEQQKRFTADVTHELRTPLTALKMETEVALLNAKTPAKELRHVLVSNLEEVSRMETLINNLLMLSSMEANKLRTIFTKLDLASIVAAATHGVAAQAAAKKVKIETKPAAALSVPVRGDQASLTQLFVILLSNAIKYSPPGATVHVLVRKGKSRLIVEIRDSGSGIPAADLPHIFDRFYRADTSRMRDTIGSAAGGGQQGYGIGLSLAKLIADLHKGEIIISSTPGVGTNVEIILSSKI